MKKIKGTVMLFSCSLFFLNSVVLASDAVSVEAIRMDGEIVVVLTPEETIDDALGNTSEIMMAELANETDFVLPHALTMIEEEAFMGIPVSSVEVLENVVTIKTRAFANCENLREVTIPDTVIEIDDYAFEGCNEITIIGVKGTEAERIAGVYGFEFKDVNEGENLDEETLEQPEEKIFPEPVVLPAAPLE